MIDDSTTGAEHDLKPYCSWVSHYYSGTHGSQYALKSMFQDAFSERILSACVCEADLQSDLLLGHGSLHRFVHLRVLDAEAAEDGKSLEELLVVPVEGPHAARRFVHLINKLTHTCTDTNRNSQVSRTFVHIMRDKWEWMSQKWRLIFAEDFFSLSFTVSSPRMTRQ